VPPVRYELGDYIPEDGILHRHRRENLKSYIVINGPYISLAIPPNISSLSPDPFVLHPSYVYILYLLMCFFINLFSFKVMSHLYLSHSFIRRCESCC
jgi:hypothetical protein